MAEDQSPFADVKEEPGGGFSIPERKWRELLFVGAVRPEAGAFVRDPTRTLPPFARSGLFPERRRFSAVPAGGRVVIRPL